MDEFHGKVAVVTGAFGGIGRAVAVLLAARGADVVAADVGGPPADDGGIVNVNADVTDDDAVRRLVGDAVARFGGLDIVVAAAGIQRYGTAGDTTPEEWDDVLAVNLTGVFRTVRHALPYLRRRPGASIVVVSSVQAFAPQTGVLAYSTSKGALNAFVRSVAVDEAPHGIRTNAVCPGSVDTPMLRAAARRFSDGSDEAIGELVATWGRMHPLGRVARPEEVAEVIAFLAGDRASFVTGVGLPVDGGLLATLPVVLREVQP